MNIEFLNKMYFLLLLLVPILMYLFYKAEKKGINFIFLEDAKKVFGGNSYKIYLKIILLGLILINFIIILANPNTINESEKIKKNGIDIVIALDISGSMDANDLKPSRIQAAKIVIDGFIKKLKTDRLGLVVFAGKPFTSIPLTFDYNILSETISRIKTGNINQQKRGLGGTAIGDSILMAKTLFKPSQDSPLKNSEQKDNNNREKVIILLTDGDANVGVDPVIAGLSAKEENIKIYTIGIGSEKGGYIEYNIGGFKQRQLMPPLNDTTLKQIAKDTNGKYFRADNNETFKDIFKELQKLEKSDIEVEVKKEYKTYYEYFIYSLIVLMMMFGFLILRNTEIGKRRN